MALKRWGRGPVPAVFLHGFAGNADAWSHLEVPLGEVFTATAFTLPGHLDSPLPPATGRDGFLQTIDAIASQISQPSVLVGYSQGARLALALAVRHPHKVERLVLESGTPGLKRHHDRALRLQEDEARAARLEAVGVEAFIDEWENLPLFEGLRALPSELREALRSRRTGHSASGLAGALRTLGLGVQPNDWPALQRLRIPTLIITGEKDFKFREIARAMVAEMPLGWHLTIPRVGHAPHLEAPREYAAEVLAFIASKWTHEPSVEAHAS